MQIIMTTGLSGPDHCLANGDPHECDDAEGQRLIDAGFARLPDDIDPAANPAPAAPRGRRRAGGEAQA